MKKAHKNLIWGVCIASFFIAMGMAAYFAPNPDEATIKGVVNAAGWDENDNIIAVSISVVLENDDDEELPQEAIEEYYVTKNDKANELIAMVGKTVLATGSVAEDEDGVKFITVKSFKIVEDEN